MRKYVIFIGLCLLSCTILAAERSVEEAAAMAIQFAGGHPALRKAAGTTQAAPVLTLAHTRTKINKDEPAFYIFNQSGKGYIVVSGDDRTEDILMYSDDGHFDPEHINPNLQFWLRHLQEEISASNDSNAVDKVAPRKITTAIAPLLKNENGKEITWSQEAPYNNLCPIDQLDNTRSLTGCVATAAAQVLYKWRYPEHGTGSKTYTWEDCTDFDWWGDCNKSKSVNLSADFENTNYDWDNMLPSYEGAHSTTAQQNAVATLMYQLGVACEMEYGGDEAGGSGALTDMMAKGLVNYFGYSVEKFVTTYSRRLYGQAAYSPAEYGVSTATLETYFNADLEEGRPIIMGGSDTYSGGHEFVCDGRDANGKFHINWGWEGEGNSYCTLTALAPSGYNSDYDFSTNIDAIIGLQPAHIDTIHVTSVTISPAQATLKINEKTTLTATVSPSNATSRKVVWTTSNPNVATVTSAGSVKGIGQGQATITATTKDGNLTASALITVTNEVIPADMFTLVTDVSTLSDNTDIILVATHNYVHYVATKNISSTAASSYMNYEQVSITDNTITLDENSAAAVMTLSKSSDSWILTGEEGNLGTTMARKVNWQKGIQTWNIGINNNAATIASTSASYGRLLFNYNNGNPRFTTYRTTTGTSADLLLPQIYARTTSISVVPVTGVTLGQRNAKMAITDKIMLYYTIQPATATNKNVTWVSDNPSVAKVDQNGNVTALSSGTATISIITADGRHAATCSIIVRSTKAEKDTVYITPSEAYAISQKMEPGEQSDQFYAVTGYVTVPNQSEYGGFWLDDNTGDTQTFQAYECAMPDGHIVLEKGSYVRVFGYLMLYKSQSTGELRIQIKNGDVEFLNPSDLLETKKQDNNPAFKYLRNGRLYIRLNGRIYDLQGHSLTSY